jgi:hypothetical protein
MTDQFSKLPKPVKAKAPKTRVITALIIVGIVVLGLTLGIPTKDEEKIDIRQLTTLIMPFNFANDKFAEFKYFVETIQQKWRTKPEDLLNLQEYVGPDKYGHSGYAIEDSGLVVEFFYFKNKLCQSTINIQDSGEAKKWIGYLDNIFGEKKPDGEFYYWNKDPLRVVYESTSVMNRFHFLHMETFIAEQEYRQKVDSNLAMFMEFKRIVNNKVKWNTNPESLPNISLLEKKQSEKWDVYTHNKISNLAYHFFQNKLCGIDFLIWDPQQAKKMQDLLLTEFGAGENEGKNGIKWNVYGITITSTSYPAASSFSFRHNQTWTEKEQYAQK